MPSFEIIRKDAEIKMGIEWIESPNFFSKDKLVNNDGEIVGNDFPGRQYKIISKFERDFTTSERFSRVFLGILIVVASLGLALFSKTTWKLFLAEKDIRRHAFLVRDFSQFDMRGSKWLDNIQLYNYIKHLKPQYPQMFVPNEVVSFIYTSENIKQFIEELEKDKNNPEYKDKTIFPFVFHVSGKHWALVIVDRLKRTIEYYDSKVNYGNHSEIIKCLTQTAVSLSQMDPHAEPYQFIEKTTTKLQRDSYQCGPWSLYFLEQRLQYPDIDFNQMDVSAAQNMIAEHRINVMNTLIRNALNQEDAP